MLLAALLKHHANIEEEIDIVGLSNDSREIKPGYLFVAYPGRQLDRREYIGMAIANGAVAVVYDPKGMAGFKHENNVPLIPISNLARVQGVIAARFYGYPSQHMQVIAVTGTNGKTSITQFVAQALELLGKRCAVVGTNGVGFMDSLHPQAMTTPDPIKLQALFAKLVKQQATACAIEASSHALDQGRLHGVDIDIGVFSNLSRDHLDYHGSMAAYAQAKLKLFSEFNLKNAIINADDELATNILEVCHSRQVQLYSAYANTSEKYPSVVATSIVPSLSGYKVNVETPAGAGEFITQLLGQFNVSNLLAVLSVLLSLKIDLAAALTVIEKLTAVDGRMQRFGSHVTPQVVVDYSHTPDALAKALLALREHCQGQLWCVFGCGGDRDRGKRKEMAKIAEQYSQKIIVTSDNPRQEQPMQIINEILTGFRDKNRVFIEPDRALAIAKAVQSARLDDMVLVAGKGHETYQIIDDEVFPFDDAEHVKVQLRKWNKDNSP